MAVPKRRKSRAKRDTRRATHQIEAKAYNGATTAAPQGAAPHLPSCGWYKDRYVIDVVEVQG
ncbi:MAG: 50S ribosomal protein L32 [bacterium]